MIKNKKGILIFVISLAVIYLIISIIFLIPTGKKYSNTVFLGSSTKVEVKNGNIKVYNEDKKTLKQDVKIYFRKKFIDGYIVSGEEPSTGVKNNLYAYNAQKEYLSIGMLIAHTPDLSINVKETSTRESNSIDEVYDFIESSGLDLSKNLDLSYLNIDIIDIDSDGNDEYIYSLGIRTTDKIESTEDIEEEYFEEDEEYSEEETTEDESTEDESEEEYTETGEYHSFVFMKKNGEYILISEEENEYEDLSNTRLYFAKLIDFNNDEKYDFVIERVMGEYGPYYYELYSFNDNSFTKIGGE